MKLTKSYKKNYSQTEQEEKIKRIFENSKREELFLFDKSFTINIKNNFFYSKITKEEFNFLFNNFTNSSRYSILRLEILKFFIEEKIIKYSISEILLLSENKIIQFLENKEFDIKKFIIKKNLNILQLDTSIFPLFYINNKTVNRFSFLILADKQNLILYKRGYKTYLLGINIKN